MIKTSGVLDDETAETMESQIVTNQDMLAWFTNFDHWADYVGLSLWVASGLFVLLGLTMMLKSSPSKSSGSDDGEAKWKQEPKNLDPGLKEEIKD